MLGGDDRHNGMETIENIHFLKQGRQHWKLRRRIYFCAHMGKFWCISMRIKLFGSPGLLTLLGLILPVFYTGTS